MTSDALRGHAAQLLGAGAVRSGAPADAVDGVVPQIVVEPASAAEAAALLEWASRDRLNVVVRGAGTKLTWGPRPASIDVMISTAPLHAVVAHRHGDLTATIQAGARLADVNRTLAQHGQWLPLDPLWAERSTIGGLVATNESGPRRHRYGSPRDLIIGIEFARADGRLAKGGGIVVKNVAGYDLPRLFTGSFGSLGLILTATFKLYPVTPASHTLVVEPSSTAVLGQLVSRLTNSHLTPTALEFATGPLRVIVRFESVAASVAQQAAAFEQMVREAGLHTTSLIGEPETQMWEEHRRTIEDGAGCLLKVSTLPTALPSTLDLLAAAGGTQRVRAAGRAGLGVFYARIDADADVQQQVINRLRDALPAGKGGVQVMQGSDALKSRLDVWGSVGDALPLMAAVKRQFDPSAVLNRGRAPGNL